MKSIEVRQEKQKQDVLDLLRKTPIVQIVCERTGVSRATFYRWKEKDKTFAKEADEALTQGASLINDLAESHLISRIKEQDLTAIIFWLKNHHPQYRSELKTEVNVGDNRKIIVSWLNGEEVTK
ncbi:MAG: phBC6A51 family helix-turn-helix protein [Candidatus Levyibacteriota bacterium]